ncbi:hypothetical protein Tco_1092454 [Tanacetum coccineum]|uniref:Xylulose kinase-1 n=1 Tax=Tanacetum coccineum TaxID=301880 RepID=A0ABQ5IA00_9ASTR
MSTLTFADTYNMVAFLEKPAESDGFHEIIDFLNANQIRYALIVNPIIYTSCIRQFWATAKANTVNGECQLQALIAKKKVIITDSSIRSDLHLEDAGGTDCLPTATIFEELTTARTTDDGEVEITASIDGQVKTITEASLRRHLKLEDSDVISCFRITSSPSLSPQTYQSPQSSPLRDITRQDAEIPQSQFPTQTQVVDEAAFKSVDVDAGRAATTNIGFEEFYTLGSDNCSLQQNELMDLVTKLTDRVEVLENDLQHTKKVYSSALTKLIMRVKKLEHRVKTRQPRRRAKVIISDTEEDLEDPSKQRRRIIEIDQTPYISLVQDEGTSWMQEDAEIQGMTSADIEILLDQEEPTELVEDLGSGEKGEKEISTANISVSTASATPEVSTAAANLVYIRRSAEKRKDKGKAIMKKDEFVQKKAKKQLEQEDLGMKKLLDCKNILMKKKNKGLLGMHK